MTVPEVETARGLVIHGRFSDAIRVLQVAEARDPADGEVLLQLATCYSSLGMPAMAVEYERRAANARPNDPTAWTAMGADLLRIGDLDRSQGAYRRALDLDPTLAVAAYELARVAARRGDASRAAHALLQALALNPDYEAAARGDEHLAKLLEETGFGKPPKRRRA